MRPTGRTAAGYREYSGEDVRRILHIEGLRSLGLSLREVGRALDDPGFTPSELVGDLIRRTRERIAAETELLTRLGRIGAAAPAGWEDALGVVALLQALRSEDAGRRQRAALSSAEEVPVPVEALVEAVLGERDPNVAGALRWALARSGGDGLAPLAQGLGSPVAEVRERAVRAVVDLPVDGATAVLEEALAHPDVVVRRCAALALGARGGPSRSRRSSTWSSRGWTTSLRPTPWARWRPTPRPRNGSPPASSTAPPAAPRARPRAAGWPRRSPASRERRRRAPSPSWRGTRTGRGAHGGLHPHAARRPVTGRPAAAQTRCSSRKPVTIFVRSSGRSMCRPWLDPGPVTSS